LTLVNGIITKKTSGFSQKYRLENWAEAHLNTFVYR